MNTIDNNEDDEMETRDQIYKKTIRQYITPTALLAIRSITFIFCLFIVIIILLVNVNIVRSAPVVGGVLLQKPLLILN